VLFDLDGTLWSLLPSNFNWDRVTRIQSQALAPHFDRLGFTFDSTEFVGRLVDDIGATLNPPSEDFSEPSWYPCLERVLASFGHTCGREDATLILDEINRVPFPEMGIRAFPDAGPALEAVRDAGYLIAAVTNNPKPAHILAEQVRWLGLPPVFDVIVSSWELGWRKPHRRPFEAALQALGVGPRETAHVGDSYENDIAPAMSLGMRTVLRQTGTLPRFEGPPPHHVISAMDALLPLLRQADR
jgi:HAD superfamily hydrolase (TIGR01509 family)